MPNNLLYVPTNRCCADQISQLASESQKIKEQTGKCILALIEHGNASWTEQHYNALLNEKKKQDLEAIHMTWTGALNFYQEIITRLNLTATDSKRLLDLLNPSDVSYGAGPNKAALIAAASGCRTMHRRDSDVRIDTWENAPAYPCIPEIQALGEKLTTLGLQGHAATAYPEVHFVGTSSFGNAPHDRRDLLAIDENYVIQLELLASPSESQEALLQETRQYLMLDPQTRYSHDFYELDLTGRTVMLCCAISEIFLELPEMPILSTLGSDYMRRNTLRYLGSPIIYHSRKVKHRYDKKRAEQEDLSAVVEYAQRDLRHMLLWPVVTRHHQNISQNPAQFVTPEGKLETENYSKSLLQSLTQAKPIMRDIPTAFASIYNNAAQSSDDKQRSERLLAIAAGIDSGPDFIQEVIQGIDDYVFLIRHWQALVNAAAAGSSVLGGLYV